MEFTERNQAEKSDFLALMKVLGLAEHQVTTGEILMETVAGGVEETPSKDDECDLFDDLVDRLEDAALAERLHWPTLCFIMQLGERRRLQRCFN